MIMGFVAAKRMMANAMGSIKPLMAPANNSNCFGFPMKTNMQVVSTIKIEMHRRSYFINAEWKVLKKETEVYEAPITEEMAALHNTTPKIRRPTSPAAK